MSFGLLHAEQKWDFFDVLHVHSLELVDAAVIAAVFDRCEQEGKGVLVTVHDVFPMFETTGHGYAGKLADIHARQIPMVTLTEGAADATAAAIGSAERPEVVPHGYVVGPGDPRFGAAKRPSDNAVTFMLYGGFRPNRSMFPACVNASFGLPASDRLRVLTRGISPVELQEGEDAQRTVDFAAGMRGRIDLEVAPFPSDDDIADFLITGHVLVMPYTWGTHSGQLETAFDLGLLPVISDVGFVRQQWEQHNGLVPEPIWFDWSDGSQYAYGSRFVEALLDGRDQAVNGRPAASDAFRQYREDEHQLILQRHAAFYEGVLSG